jgi:CHAT domain-containing protein
LTKWQEKIPSSLIRERDALRAALKKIHQTPGEGQRRALSDSTVFDIEQKLWSVERKIKNQFLPYQYSHLAEISRDFLKASLLSEDELLLNFITLNDEVGVFLMSAFDQKYYPLPVSARTLSSDLHKLTFVCERAVFGFEKNERTSSDINHILRRIYGYLIKPIKALTEKKNLILLANGDFFQIPFGALINEEGQYLKDLHNISFVCDPVDILNRAKPLPPFLQSKNAVFAAGSENLPSIAVEARKINETFTRTNVYIDSRANSKNLLTELKNSNGFLHIAAHASRSSENPLFSKIILDDGPLFPFDIYGVNLRPTLITLSGCHTAAPGLYYGNSFSLAKAYYQAGSRFVLASLWPVSDKISSFFMIQFYRALAKNNDVGFAYKKAVDITMNIIDNPALWSSFIVLGI